MSHIVDMMDFPATPQEMEWLLKLEDKAKQDGGLTHQGLTGYMVVYGNTGGVKSGQASLILKGANSGTI